MLKFIRRNLYIIASLLIVLVFSLSYIFLHSVKTSNNIYMSKLSGDENVLKDIEISGIIQDEYSGVAFKFNDREVNQKFLYYKYRQDHLENRANFINYSSSRFGGNGLIKLSSGIYRLGYGYDYQYDGTGVYLTKYTDKDVIGKKVVEGDVRCVNHKLQHRYRTRFVEELNRKIYFVIPTCNLCYGKSGIYEVSDFSKLKDTDETASEEKGYRKLADIDLEEGKITVNGMYLVGDNLCLILIDNKKMKVKAYNLKEEKFLQPFEIKLKHKDAYNFIQVTGYINGNNLSLLIDNVYTLNISDEISLVSEIDISYIREKVGGSKSNYCYAARSSNDYIVDMTYKNDKLYIVYNNDLPIMVPKTPDKTRGKYLELFVYDKLGSMVFHGKIETSVMDDYMWWLGLAQDENVDEWYKLKYRYKQMFNIVNRRFEQIKIY